MATFEPLETGCISEARFFFQAEDGIRDLYVTGVQTCALPILVGGTDSGRAAADVAPRSPVACDRCRPPGAACIGVRSEERRVGKECRSRRPPENRKKKCTTPQ